jgi:hypothetical protein
MSSLVEQQRNHFTDRIKRIEAGGPNTSATVYAGIDEQLHRKKKRRNRRVNGGSLLFGLLMMPFAFAMGAGLMLVGRAGAYAALSEPELIAPESVRLFALTADIGIAAGLALVLVPLFSIGHGARLVAFMLGFTGVMVAESYVISKAPGPFASVFSEEYVDTAIATAPENPIRAASLGLF